MQQSINVGCICNLQPNFQNAHEYQVIVLQISNKKAVIAPISTRKQKGNIIAAQKTWYVDYKNIKSVKTLSLQPVMQLTSQQAEAEKILSASYQRYIENQTLKQLMKNKKKQVRSIDGTWTKYRGTTIPAKIPSTVKYKTTHPYQGGGCTPK